MKRLDPRLIFNCGSRFGFERRSALRGSPRFGFARLPNALNLELDLLVLFEVAFASASWRVVLLRAQMVIARTLPPKDTKTKRTFHGVSRRFHPFKVPTKVDAGKSSCIWPQWTWKPSPRSIGFHAEKNAQSRKAQDQTPIAPVNDWAEPTRKLIPHLS
jgi:hypothetical protein